MEAGENEKVFDTGAKRQRDTDATRFDLVSPIGYERIARTYAEGAAKYADKNWELGMPIHDLLNHVKAHINKYESGDRSEDHFAHAAWGLFSCMHSEVMWPHLNEPHLRGPNCVLTDANIVEIKRQQALIQARRQDAASAQETDL